MVLVEIRCTTSLFIEIHLDMNDQDMFPMQSKHSAATELIDLIFNFASWINLVHKMILFLNSAVLYILAQ